jgi:hypothetical protein
VCVQQGTDWGRAAERHRKVPVETVLALGPTETVQVVKHNYREVRGQAEPVSKITIGGKQYWRLADDPKAYR